MDIDRQAIERRDFPIGRRGYDPAAVDAHLRGLANEIEELQRARIGAGAEASLASTAGSQVQGILAAAEAAAADIERQARQSARTEREEADRDAARTREEAIEQARAHVAAVAQATSVLLERVSSLDNEVSALVESLRAGASRLAGDLAAVETNMGELYDAASATNREPSPAATVTAAAKAGVDPSPEQAGAARAGAPAAPLPAVAPSEQPPRSAAAAAPAAPAAAGKPTVENGDLDGARLIALNMALNGESRADAERYLAEHFQLADRQKLIDEVYAAIEE